MNRHIRIVAAARAIVVCLSLFAAVAVAETSAPPAQVVVTGDIETPRSFGVDDLRKLGVQQIDDTRQGRTDGEPKSGQTPRRYSGVLLRDVITAAKPVEKQPRDFRRSIVVVTASDGYKAVFSWAELFLSPIGDGALVVFERDGVPLAPGEGPLALVSLRDTQPGPRHVKWLAKIELRRVAD